MEGWVDLVYPAVHRPGVDLVILRSHALTTTLPSHRWFPYPDFALVERMLLNSLSLPFLSWWFIGIPFFSNPTYPGHRVASSKGMHAETIDLYILLHQVGYLLEDLDIINVWFRLVRAEIECITVGNICMVEQANKKICVCMVGLKANV